MAATKGKKAVPVAEKKGKKLPHHRACFATSNTGVPGRQREIGDLAREPEEDGVWNAVGPPLEVF
jgi:hypothetical protein